MINKKDLIIDINFIKQIFNDKYDGVFFVIYPYIVADNDMCGSINIEQNEWDGVINKLIEFKRQITVIDTVHVYRDIERIIDENKKISVVQKNTLFVEHNNRNLVVLFRSDTLDISCFPNLNVYDDEYIRIIQKYKFDEVTLNLVTIKKEICKYNHIEISFQYKTKLKNKIIGDLSSINKCFT